MLRMWDDGVVECSGRGMLGTWDVGEVWCCYYYTAVSDIISDECQNQEFINGAIYKCHTLDFI